MILANPNTLPIKNFTREMHNLLYTIRQATNFTNNNLFSSSILTNEQSFNMIGEDDTPRLLEAASEICNSGWKVRA